MSTCLQSKIININLWNKLQMASSIGNHCIHLNSFFLTTMWFTSTFCDPLIMIASIYECGNRYFRASYFYLIVRISCNGNDGDGSLSGAVPPKVPPISFWPFFILWSILNLSSTVTALRIELLYVLFLLFAVLSWDIRSGLLTVSFYLTKPVVVLFIFSMLWAAPWIFVSAIKALRAVVVRLPTSL